MIRDVSRQSIFAEVVGFSKNRLTAYTYMHDQSGVYQLVTRNLQGFRN